MWVVTCSDKSGYINYRAITEQEKLSGSHAFVKWQRRGARLTSEQNEAIGCQHCLETIHFVQQIDASKYM